jgi:hypothetical protein
MICDLHKTFYTTHCRECLHDEAKIANQLEKVKLKNVNKLLKQKSKSSERKAPINKVSEKRKEQNHEYFKLVEQYKRDNPECAVRLGGCTGATEDPHHKRGRGKYLLDVTTWLPVCRNCHIYIENHPEEAKEKGWSESRLKKEFDEPHKI